MLAVTGTRAAVCPTRLYTRTQTTSVGLCERVSCTFVLACLEGINTNADLQLLLLLLCHLIVLIAWRACSEQFLPILPIVSSLSPLFALHFTSKRTRGKRRSLRMMCALIACNNSLSFFLSLSIPLPDWAVSCPETLIVICVCVCVWLLLRLQTRLQRTRLLSRSVCGCGCVCLRPCVREGR